MKQRRLGGIQGLQAETDLGKIWNSIFFKKVGNMQNVDILRQGINNVPQPITGGKALFVIDMQNDFLDRTYPRILPTVNSGTPFAKEVHPVHGKKSFIGNFAVGGGADLINDKNFMNYIFRAIDDAEYKHVIFSRDYHPIGHSSFDGSVFTEYPQFFCQECTEPGQIAEKAPDTLQGNFPPHCVQGFMGTRLNYNIENVLRQYYAQILYLITDGQKLPNLKEDKVQILFKGIHQNADSFTAVPKTFIDGIASNKTLSACDNNSCSSISGGYRRRAGNLLDDITFNEPVPPDQIDTIFQQYTKEDYLSMFDGVETIEVCGLAGDYCVRDTVVALSEMFSGNTILENKTILPKKNVVLLTDFTRYAILPFASIRTLPQHIATESEQTQFTPESEDEIYRKVTTTTTSERESRYEKDIVHYLLTTDKNGFKLLSAKEIQSFEHPAENFNDVNFRDLLFKLPPDPTYQHFITPHDAIARDYNKENIFLVGSNQYAQQIKPITTSKL